KGDGGEIDDDYAKRAEETPAVQIEQKPLERQHLPAVVLGDAFAQALRGGGSFRPRGTRGFGAAPPKQVGACVLLAAVRAHDEAGAFVANPGNRSEDAVRIAENPEQIARVTEQ